MMQSRNHHPNGQAQILQQISMHFHLPSPCVSSQKYPCQPNNIMHYWRHMLWMTQINQAVGYKVEVEHFRRIRTECTADQVQSVVYPQYYPY
jgi:hypothetical protein